MQSKGAKSKEVIKKYKKLLKYNTANLMVNTGSYLCMTLKKQNFM